jgi:hypothetical protein
VFESLESVRHIFPSSVSSGPSSRFRHRLPSDTAHRTRDTRHRTPELRHRTPELRHRTPDTAHQNSDTAHRTPDTAHQLRHRTPRLRHCTQEIRHRTPDLKHRTPELTHRTQNSDIVHQNSYTALQISAYFLAAFSSLCLISACFLAFLSLHHIPATDTLHHTSHTRTHSQNNFDMHYDDAVSPLSPPKVSSSPTKSTMNGSELLDTIPNTNTNTTKRSYFQQFKDLQYNPDVRNAFKDYLRTPLWMQMFFTTLAGIIVADGALLFFCLLRAFAYLSEPLQGRIFEFSLQTINACFSMLCAIEVSRI